MDVDLLLEAERRGLLPPDKQAMLTEARSRGLVPGGAPQGPAEVPGVFARMGHGISNVGTELQKLYQMATSDKEGLAATQAEQNDSNARYDRGVATGQAQAKQQFGDVGTLRSLAANVLPMGADLQAQAFNAAGGGPDVASEVGRNLPMLPAMVAAAPVGIVGRIAMGAGLGGMQGLTETDANATPLSKATMAGRGAVVGAGTQGLIEAGTAAAQPVYNAAKQAFAAVSNRLSGATEPKAVELALSQGLKDAGIDWNTLDASRQGAIVKDATATLKAGRELDADALLRKADFDALQSPYTLGQVQRDPRQWTAEQRVRKIEGVGDPLQGTLERQNQVLADQLPAMRAATGSKVGSGYEAAENARTAVQGFAKESQNDVRKLYDTARTSSDANTILPHDPVAQSLSNIVEDYGVENIKPAIISRAKEFGLLGGDVRRRWLTIDEAERFRKLIGNNTDWKDPTSAAVGKSLQSSLDDAVGMVGTDAGNAFSQARAAAKDRFAQLEPTPVAALNKTDEAPVNFVETKILGGKPGELEALRSVVTKQDPKAWDDVRASVLDWLTKKAQNRGTFNGGAFKDALDRVGQARLKVLFNDDELSKLGTLSRAGFNATVPPPLAAVNYSNTASELANLVTSKDTGPGILGKALGHIPAIGPAAVGAYQAGKGALVAGRMRAATEASAAPDLAAVSPASKASLEWLAKLLMRAGPQAAAGNLPSQDRP